MLTFNQLPPTADSTDVDAAAIRQLAYGSENRCINGVAEVAASLVMAQNGIKVSEAEAIGDKIARVITTSPVSKYPEADATCFVNRFKLIVGNIAMEGATV